MKTILLISPYWKEPHRWMVSTVKLADLWQRIGYRVVVACMGDVSGQTSAVSGRKTGKEVVSPTLTIYRKKDLFLPDPWNYGIAFGFTRFVRKIITTEKPDVIVANKILFWTSFCLIWLRLRGIRVQLITDALVGMTWWPRGKIPQIAAAIYAWTAGWLILRCAQRIVFFHPQPESLLRRLGILKKSRVIPTGIDPSAYGRTEEVSGQKSVVRVTYIGRLESIKGADDFLAAAAPLQAQYPDLTVRVVGWYKDGHPLVAQYKDQVDFTGLRNDIPDQLRATDIFVMPSYSEGLSNAIMEAMSSGVAIIASDVGGNRYLIQNGVTGFLFPAGDREALRSHIRRLIEDPTKRKALGVAARKRIDEVFSWEKVGEQYAKFFQEATA